MLLIGHALKYSRIKIDQNNYIYHLASIVLGSTRENNCFSYFHLQHNNQNVGLRSQDISASFAKNRSLIGLFATEIQTFYVYASWDYQSTGSAWKDEKNAFCVIYLEVIFFKTLLTWFLESRVPLRYINNWQLSHRVIY